MSGRHGHLGSDVIDVSAGTYELPELGVVDHRPGLVALATSNSSGDRLSVRCQGLQPNRQGKGRTGVQRRRCCHCGRTFCSTTGTMLAGLHAPDKLGIVNSDMLPTEPSSCRRLANSLQLSRMMIWAQRQLANRAFAVIQPIAGKQCGNPRIEDTSELAMTVLRESRKASRDWIDQRRGPARCPATDRLRWVDYRMSDLPLPQPIVSDLVTVSFDANCQSRH